jgi:hypothetical protein
MRRATRDLDMDFIKYSLEDDSIIDFIKKLNMVEDGIEISIIGTPEKLHQADYDGKRINIKLIDLKKYEVNTKIDLGVHKLFDIEQDEYCFDLSLLNENVSLLINSLEQIFVEKLKSLLKFGITSTRYKDIFDFYFLINNTKMKKDIILEYIKILIFNDETMRENNLEDIIDRIEHTLNSDRYIKGLKRAQNNWLNLPVNEVTENVITFLKSLNIVSVN